MGLDHLIQQIQSRFNGVKTVSSRFSCILWPAKDPSFRKEKAHRLVRFYSADVKEDDFLEEIHNFTRLRKMVSFLSWQLFISLKPTIFSRPAPHRPHPFAFFFAFLTRCHYLSVRVIKIIKSYFRSTMGQEPLSNIVCLIENCLTNSLSYDEVISNFASKKAKKCVRISYIWLCICDFEF